MAFKVKTTAPKLYCVRPNASIVAPGESVKISLILQGFSQPLAKDYKCKDKFLIVSLPCPGLDDPSKVSESWSQLESKYKEQLLQKKLKVNFIITSDDDDDKDESQINDTTYANTTQSAPLSAPVAAGGAAVANVSPLSKDVSEKADINSEKAPPTNGSAADTTIVGSDDARDVLPSAFASGASAGGAFTKDVAEPVDTELEQSNARISTMSEKFDSNESAASAPPVKSTTEEPVSGVSLPLAVFLVLLALFLGWYIF